MKKGLLYYIYLYVFISLTPAEGTEEGGESENGLFLLYSFVRIYSFTLIF